MSQRATGGPAAAAIAARSRRKASSKLAPPTPCSTPPIVLRPTNALLGFRTGRGRKPQARRRQPRDALTRLEAAGSGRGGRAGATPLHSHASDERRIFGTEKPLQPPSDLAGQRGAPAAGRDGDLELAAAKHRGQDEVAVLGPVVFVLVRPPPARHLRHRPVHERI